MDVITSYHWQLLRVTLCWNRVKGPVISLQHWELYTKHTMVLWGEQLWHSSSAHRSSPLGQRERNSGYTVKDDICEQQKSREKPAQSPGKKRAEICVISYKHRHVHEELHRDKSRVYNHALMSEGGVRGVKDAKPVNVFWVCISAFAGVKPLDTF